MNQLIQMFLALLPEFALAIAACVLFVIGTANAPQYRRGAALLALLTLVLVFLQQALRLFPTMGGEVVTSDPWNAVSVTAFSNYVKLITSGVGILLVLLAWPTNAEATGGNAFEVGHELAEFYGLMLLSICGVFVVASANDIILLFLGIELASIPTYVMVSISRPVPVAQEAGVKYFFLGAMSAAIMLFGLSYLYGTTGLLKLDEISDALRGTLVVTSSVSVPDGATLLHTGAGWTAVPPPDAGGGPTGHAAPTVLTPWQILAVLMVMAGFAFKIAAVPLHTYAGDVYTGAATPVTAFLAFVPKTSGFVAIVKLLFVVGGAAYAVPDVLVKLLWVIAVLTMTFGNVLALLANNVKRVLAYSSVAHSGYMLVGLTAMVAARDQPDVQSLALQGVLFYLAIYGVMNVGAFGVLQLLPSRLQQGSPRDAAHLPPATTAETYEDLAGQGRRHVGIGLALAISCFALTGLPLTAGFWGKVYLVQPVLELPDRSMKVLAGLVMLNAAISAGYYLKIIATLFLRPDPHGPAVDGHFTPVPQLPMTARPVPVLIAVGLSATGVLLAGAVPAVTDALGRRVEQGAHLEPSGTAGVGPVAMR